MQERMIQIEISWHIMWVPFLQFQIELLPWMAFNTCCID